MSEPISINEARAEKAQDACLWTPLDCLKALVREIESGEMKSVDAIYVAMVRKTPNGLAQSFPFYTAGAKPLELRGLLSQHLHDICASFQHGR